MTHPPAGPSTPPPPSGPKDLAGDLDAIDLLLRTAELVAYRRLSGTDPALHLALVERLRLTRRAVADLQTPARRDPFSAAVGADATATTGGPVSSPRPRGEVRVGGPLPLGADFIECGEPTPEGRCDLRAGHPVGPIFPGYSGHMHTGEDAFSLPQPQPWPGRRFPVREVSA
jgi:hypothetical protein